ncbi:GNAT family N-acetyltransferase [Leuconostoc falkenbergense]|uniref:GNAT family N-acetyltransferase n=1 Tax=Leuconostoc falkenbergense TaxID=2766470 RepID=UPI0021AA8BF2|nr:GNAT family N-acetyltransferase [Leuconostoc falkenbergense]MCT4411725.1 GNAT family N-acetyltransferase [Leuconostoc falkenbergense]
MTIEIKHQKGLGPIQADALIIRKTVFVIEQGVAISDEMDDTSAEEEAIHIVAYVDGKLAATARVLPESATTWYVQRVATLYPARGKGLGSKLFAYIEQLAPEYGIKTLVLGAQVQARGFYDRLGFSAFDEEFIEAGIQHIHMKKALS